MRKLIAILMMLMLVIGCRSKTSMKQKEVFQSQVESTVQVEAQVTKVEKKDSVIKVKEKVEEKQTSTKVKVEFDPKKNDSLEVKYAVGNDSIHLKINGNGQVTFEHKHETKTTEQTTDKIYGSETLFKIDSTMSGKKSDIINTKAVLTNKNVKSNGFDFGAYMIIGLCLLALVILWFLWSKFGGNTIDRFKKFKNKFK